MKKIVAAIAAAVLGFVVGLQPASAQRALTPVTDAMLQKPDPADWLMWRRTLDSWGYSPLNQINRTNVAQLRWSGRAAWARAIQEGTPLVHDGVMYLPNPSDHIQAIDATTGDLIWEYKRKLPDDLGKFIPVPEHQPQPRDLRQPDHRHQRRQLHLRARRADRQAGLGNADPRLPRRRRAGDRRARSSPTARSSPAAAASPNAGRDACVITAHDAEDRQGTVAHPHHSRPGRAGRRVVGQHSRCEAAGTSARGWCRATIRS